MTEVDAEGTDPLDARAAIGGGGFGGIGSPRALIGQGLDESDTHVVLDRCVALGVTIVDTAYGYAAGDSHRMIGRWLAADPARRARIAIVDKVGTVDGPDGLTVDLSRASVARCAEEGRARMGVEAVDVLMTHAPDPATPIRETLTALAEEVELGRDLAWGVSNVDGDELTTWLDEARRLGAPLPVIVENQYSLLERRDEDDVLPRCRRQGITYLAFSPLAGGVLTGKYRRGEAPPAGSRLAQRPDTAGELTSGVHDRIDAFVGRATERAISPAALALAWVLAQPGVRPIAGARTPAHLDALAEALDVHLTPADAEVVAADLRG